MEQCIWSEDRLHTAHSSHHWTLFKKKNVYYCNSVLYLISISIVTLHSIIWCFFYFILLYIFLDKYLSVLVMSLEWKHPFSAIVAGPSGSGKSHFVIRFVTNLRHMCDTEFKNIFWHYGAGGGGGGVQPLADTRIQYKPALPNMDDFDGGDDGASLITIDDM